jgi:hypothetical protein
MGGPAYSPQGFPPFGAGGGYPGGGCAGGACGPNGGGYGGGYGPYGGMQFNPMMQGTLVFPNHPFVRSPRDYFMVDVNKW